MYIYIYTHNIAIAYQIPFVFKNQEGWSSNGLEDGPIPKIRQSDEAVLILKTDYDGDITSLN